MSISRQSLEKIVHRKTLYRVRASKEFSIWDSKQAQDILELHKIRPRLYATICLFISDTFINGKLVQDIDMDMEGDFHAELP